MTIEETKLILSKMRGLYPAFFDDMTNERKRLMLKAWSKELESYSVDQVRNAIDTLVIESKYMPKLADVVRQINDQSGGGRSWMRKYSNAIAMLSNESVSRYARTHSLTWEQANQKLKGFPA